MKLRRLGKSEVMLPAIGLGCMGMSHAYGEGNDEESIKVLHKALDLGINFWDTADFYGSGKNEELLSKVLQTNRDKVFIATKFGFRVKEGIRTFRTMEDAYLDCSPVYIKKAVEASLKRLKINTIDLYYAHRVDPKIPIEETVGAMGELVKEGKVRYIGLSEASTVSIRKANKVHPVSALQSEYSLLTRDIEKEIIPACRELGIAVVPFSPLVRGLMTNTIKNENLAENDFRKTIPRFDDAHWKNNKSLAEGFAILAKDKGCTPAQLALAWVLARGEDIIPIPGTKKMKYLEENAKAADVKLTQTDLNDIENLIKEFPDVGPRYSASAQRIVDKE